MKAALQRMWSSLGVRMAFFYGGVVAIALLTAFGVLYSRTVGITYQRMTALVKVEIDDLVSQYPLEGVDGISRKMTNALSDGINSYSEIYLLTDSQGRKVAGNLDTVADAPQAGTEEVRDVLRAGKPSHAYLVARELPNGGLIVVGYDLSEQQALDAMIRHASIVAGLVASLLLGGATFIFRRVFNQGITELRSLMARVGAGELHRRVEVAGQHDEFQMLHQDINDMLERVQELMNGVRQVSDTVAHNLRTPLTRVMLRLRRASESQSTAEEYRAAIAEGLCDLEEVVITFEKLLQIAEAEAGTKRRSFELVALDVLADDALEFYDALSGMTAATLERNPAEPVLVQGDPVLLSSVIANLVDNALKYGGHGVHVRIGTHCAGDTVVLSVQDSGPGIPEVEYSKIGARFYRLKTEQMGHGLGLASVRAIVELHQGKVHLADARPGLRVEIELPSAHREARSRDP